MKKFNQNQLAVGCRLFLASLVLLLTNMFAAHAMKVAFIVAGIIMVFPSWSYKHGYLRTGATKEEEEAELLNKITKTVTKILKDSAKDTFSKEEIDERVNKVNKEIEKLTNESLKKLSESMEALVKKNENFELELKKANETIVMQGAEIKKFKDNGIVDDLAKKKTFGQALKDAFDAMPKKDEIIQEVNDDYGKRLSMKAWFESRGKNATTPAITIKAAVDMFQANIVGNYVANLRLTELDPTRVSIPLTIYPHVMNVFASKPIRKPYMSLLVVGTYFDGAATKAEGVAAGQSSFLLTTVTFPAFFVSTYFNLSDETLDDLEEVMAEIELVAPDKIMDKIDTYILGTAGDDVTAIKGIRTAAKSTAYATVFGAASIQGAYIVDVIADAKLQVENAKYRPDLIYLHPTDFAKLAAKKNNMNDSMTDKRVSYNSLGEAVAVCGLAIVKSTAITADQMLILDSRQPMIGRRRDLTMEIGYNGTDFVEGQRTVILKARLAFGVRDPLGVVWVNGINAAIAALTTL